MAIEPNANRTETNTSFTTFIFRASLIIETIVPTIHQDAVQGWYEEMNSRKCAWWPDERALQARVQAFKVNVNPNADCPEPSEADPRGFGQWTTDVRSSSVYLGNTSQPQCKKHRKHSTWTITTCAPRVRKAATALTVDEAG